MNIIFCGSKGKTGSVVFNYLINKGYVINNEINSSGNTLKDVIDKESIVIDFTNQEAAIKHAKICLENKSHFICGTTGIDKKAIEIIEKEALKNNLHFFFKPNFSLTIPLIENFLQNLNKSEYDITIIESHHISKKDLPSGTALLLKEKVPDAKIESIRTTYPSLDHTIIIKSDYEEIKISHSVKNKLAYAKGVEKILNKLISIL